MKKLIYGVMVLMCLSCSTAATSSNIVEISTNYGSILIKLESEKAPTTVKNFLGYVDAGFYDGTIFHRVIDNFMIQGGGFTQNMVKKDTKKPIINESHNQLSNVVGTIAMARTSDPHSATSQFYINVANNTFLNYKSEKNPGYCVFGRVIEGMPIIQKIKMVNVGNFDQYQNVPIEPVIIKRIRRVSKKEFEKSKSFDTTSSKPLPTMN
jgi:peptidyl-prolyl cis-trans isomerase B (cyclophilin B)